MKVVTTLKAKKIEHDKLTAAIAQQKLALELDEKALRKLEEKVASGIPLEKAMATEMTSASAAANGNVISLDKLTKSSKAAELAMKGLALAGNIFVSLVISKVISTVYEMAQASDTVGKAAKEAADELITQRQNGVQFRIGKYNILAFHSTRISLHKIVELWNQIISKIGNSDISPRVVKYNFSPAVTTSAAVVKLVVLQRRLARESKNWRDCMEYKMVQLHFKEINMR